MAKRGGVTYDQRNAYDIDDSLKAFYAGSNVKIGKDVGDVLQVKLEDLEDSEGLIVGALCQGWSSAGQRLGKDDPRSEVTEVMISWIETLAWRGCLQWFAMENSPRLADIGSAGDTEDPHLSFMDMLMRRLRGTTPFFEVEYACVNLKDLHPHVRRRGWMRGIRVDCIKGLTVPRYMEKLGVLPKPSLEHILVAHAKHQIASLLTKSAAETSLGQYTKGAV